jgi:hypothetical protein
MSHFVVLVLDTLDGESVESQLEPFGQDNEAYYRRDIEVEASEVKAEAESIIKELLKRIEKNPDEWHIKTSTEYKQLFDKGEYAEIVTRYNGWSVDEDGNMYSEYNPDCRWDWYEVGGRWSGFFKFKPNHKDTPVISGHFSQTPEEVEKLRKAGRTDVATVKEIDWEGMRQEARETAIKTWEKYGEQKGKNDGLFIYDIRKDDTKESYVKRHSSIAPFAVLHDGEWSERGSMGWFGMVSDEDDKWEEQFDALVEMLIKKHPLMEITAVDCHI